MKLLVSLAASAAFSFCAPQARAESRSVLIVIAHDKDRKAKVTIYSDDKQDRREGVTVEEAVKSIGEMRGWGSIVFVAVVTDRGLARKDRKQLFAAIDDN